MIAKENGFDERYVANVSEKSIEPLSHDHRPSVRHALHGDHGAAHPGGGGPAQIIENFAKQGDCVIIGRCADVILKDYHP